MSMIKWVEEEKSRKRYNRNNFSEELANCASLESKFIWPLSSMEQDSFSNPRGSFQNFQQSFLPNNDSLHTWTTHCKFYATLCTTVRVSKPKSYITNLKRTSPSSPASSGELLRSTSSSLELCSSSSSYMNEFACCEDSSGEKAAHWVLFTGLLLLFAELSPSFHVPN